MTQQQAESLLAVAPVDRGFRYVLLLNTGMRKGESLGLRWRDIDLDRRTIRIVNAQKGTGQKHLFRTVPIPAVLLNELLDRQAGPDDAVLSTGYNWTRDLKIDLKKAGIADFRIHDMRHTYASWLAQSGVTLHQIRDLLGHASVKTTEIYAYLIPGAHDGVLRVLDDLGSNKGAKNGKKGTCDE